LRGGPGRSNRMGFGALLPLQTAPPKQPKHPARRQQKRQRAGKNPHVLTRYSDEKQQQDQERRQDHSKDHPALRGFFLKRLIQEDQQAQKRQQDRRVAQVVLKISLFKEDLIRHLVNKHGIIRGPFQIAEEEGDEDEKKC
jgi:hypothetical protein